VSLVHLIVPAGIDDPARPSGGNVFDRRLRDGLTAAGWAVHVQEIPGSWPHPDAPSLAALADAVARIPDGAVVLLDGLVASAAPEALVPAAERLRLVVLVHMPLGQNGAGPDVRAREAAVLAAARSVVVPSAWARRVLRELYALPDDRVQVVEPGADVAEPAPGTPTGGSLLSVAAVIPGKGHDVLVEALARLDGLPWECRCVGSLDRDPAFADGLRRRVRAGGLEGRVRFSGPQTGVTLDRSYAGADVLVLPSRGETYGMVVTEALARGLPVIAADVGGVPEALGHGAGGSRPGLLVPPEDPGALGDALRAWLRDASLRSRLRRAARERRETLASWTATTSAVADVLTEAAR
jgi:glycosyltransferase involved in cell wall biosynthesis